MSLWKLALASLRHFWRTNLWLMLGIAIGTAVLTGALIVGDSIRGSLKSLTIERLGRIDEILIGEQFFRAELVNSLDEPLKSKLNHAYSNALPTILLNQATVERVNSNSASRAHGVTVVGASAAFWDLRTIGDAPKVPAEGQIVINQSLADELGAQVGDLLLLRVGKPSSLAVDSPLARKSDLVKTIVDLELIDIMPATGLGRFSLQASQQVPANAFVNLATLQEGLDQEGKVNAILVAGENVDHAATEQDFQILQNALQPTIDDLGISLDRVAIKYETGDEEITLLQYDTLTNDRMLFALEQDAIISSELVTWNAQPVFTYLATKIQKLDTDGEPIGQIVPYSTITGIDSTEKLGPLTVESGEPIEIRDNQIVINSWTAAILDVDVSDTVRVTFFEPETTHGETIERSEDFVLQAIARITDPDLPFSRRRDAVFTQPPTLANDPNLTPRVVGITDAETIDKWDAPFPMDRTLLRGRDDDYWQYFRTTPKAFVSRRTSQRLWPSRFGDTTSYRIPASEETISARRDRLSAALTSNYGAFGMHWLRVKRDGLAASSGTTPFDALFFGFSMFIIASALILVSLLLRLSMEQRASQLGLVGALGFDWKRSFRWLLAENSAIVIGGGLLGVLIGIAYAWLMLAGLRTLWVEAVVTPFMRLTVTPHTLVVGFLLGVIASLCTIGVTLRRLRTLSLSQLMVGKTEQPSFPTTSTIQRRWIGLIPWGLLVLALFLGGIAPSLPPEPQGGAFFGSGTCVLVALLMWVSQRLNTRASASSVGNDLDVNTLAARNLTRNPTRSTLTIGLVATACFLIVAISAFRLTPTDRGTGGFELVGLSDRPIFEELQDDNDDAHVFALRMQDGDDASCRNLYQSSKPRLIGIGPDFIEGVDGIGSMDWAGVDAGLPSNASKWNVLTEEFQTDSEVIPVVLDKNTAMYSMQIYTGVGTEFERDYGPAGILKFRIVGLLSGSIFQGSLLVPESDLKKHFPRIGGYRYFLVDANSESVAVANQLEETYSDEGLDLTDSNRLLTELLAVQNTYLSTFQSLGGLGLLLGTLGLAAVQLRNVIQRRGELAILRATGFRDDQLSLLILREHAFLLLGGLAVGVVAALVVIFPHIMFGGASVPVTSLVVTLGLVTIVGLTSALFAQRYLQKMPLLPALRGD